MPATSAGMTMERLETASGFGTRPTDALHWPGADTRPPERTRMDDRKSKLAEHNYYDELLALRDTQRERIRHGIQVIKEADLPIETNRQGLMRWYLHPAIKDTALATLVFFQQEIPPGS